MVADLQLKYEHTERLWLK